MLSPTQLTIIPNMAPPSTLPYATTTVAVSQTYSPLQKVEILAPEQLVTIPSGLPQEQGIEVDPAKIKAIIDEMDIVYLPRSLN